MTISAFQGPVGTFGQGTYSDYNPEAGPSFFYSGAGILDPRTPFTYQPGQDFGAPTYMFLGFTDIPLVDQAPSTISATNISAAAVPTAGTALTLVSSTGGGITVGQSITNSATGTAVTGLLVIDSAPAGVAFGSANTVKIWDPTKAVARNVCITSVGDDHLATVLVSGYDQYWYPVSERITLSNATVASGKKAFKYIASIVPSGTLSGSNISVGTGDVYGLPLRADQWAYVSVFWNGALITSSTGFTVADTTNPATTTTGDVRGTYAVQSASDGTKKLQVFLTPQVSNIGTIAGLFGITQI